jgi:hypothetical protein
MKPYVEIPIERAIDQMRTVNAQHSFSLPVTFRSAVTIANNRGGNEAFQSRARDVTVSRDAEFVRDVTSGQLVVTQ